MPSSAFRLLTMVSWFDLRQCTNPSCAFKGSCRKFCPPPPLEDLSAHLLLVSLCLCGCRGMQHDGDLSLPVRTLTPNPIKIKRGGDSDSARQGSAGSGPAPNLSPDGEGAQARTKGLHGELLQEIKAQVLFVQLHRHLSTETFLDLRQRSASTPDLNAKGLRHHRPSCRPNASRQRRRQIRPSR